VGHVSPLLSLRNCTKLYRDPPLCPFCPFCPLIESATYVFSVGRASSNPTRAFRCYVRVFRWLKQIRHSDVLGDRCSLSLVQAQTMNGAIAPRPALSTCSPAQRQRFSNHLLSHARYRMRKGSCFSETKVNLVGGVNPSLAHSSL
jgi:hypothetical protein